MYNACAERWQINKSVSFELLVAKDHSTNGLYSRCTITAIVGSSDRNSTTSVHFCVNAHKPS